MDERAELTGACVYLCSPRAGLGPPVLSFAWRTELTAAAFGSALVRAGRRPPLTDGGALAPTWSQYGEVTARHDYVRRHRLA